jgi:hypothetical protein
MAALVEISIIVVIAKQISSCLLSFLSFFLLLAVFDLPM